MAIPQKIIFITIFNLLTTLILFPFLPILLRQSLSFASNISFLSYFHFIHFYNNIQIFIIQYSYSKSFPKCIFLNLFPLYSLIIAQKGASLLGDNFANVLVFHLVCLLLIKCLLLFLFVHLYTLKIRYLLLCL